MPDNASRASAVPSIQPLLALWPIANGPELLTSAGANSGIAEAFSNPRQHIREDFGTLRFDQILSQNDSLAAVYTIDDSQANSPTSNPVTFVNLTLREQVVSLSETHIFSPTVVNRATFGFSRGAFYFNSGTTVELPGLIHADQPVGAVVVGGGTTLNGASQITNGGTNAGSNLSAVRNLFTGNDQVTFTHGSTCSPSALGCKEFRPMTFSCKTNTAKLLSPICKLFCRAPSAPTPSRQASRRSDGVRSKARSTLRTPSA